MYNMMSLWREDDDSQRKKLFSQARALGLILRISLSGSCRVWIEHTINLGKDGVQRKTIDARLASNRTSYFYSPSQTDPQYCLGYE
jgi:hypothetical protein